jgi:hemerythrin
MSFITWSKEQFGTNVGVHDEEHKTIFGKLNTLHEAVSKEDRSAVGSHFDELVDIVAKHFASEEDSMAKHGYEAADQHKQEHDELVQTCLDLQSRFKSGQTEITEETTVFVREWLLKHVPVVDRSYGPFLNSKGMT